LVEYLQTAEGQRSMRSGAVQLAQANLSLRSVARTVVPLPSLATQVEIAAAVALVDARIRRESAWFQKLRAVRAGVAVDLLTGRLRTVPV
jgi:hypothetical protein